VQRELVETLEPMQPACVSQSRGDALAYRHLARRATTGPNDEVVVRCEQ
jgi:hypothetical protein